MECGTSIYRKETFQLVLARDLAETRKNCEPTKIRASPIDTHGFAMKDVFRTRVVSYDIGVFHRDVLNFLVLWMVREYES